MEMENAEPDAVPVIRRHGLHDGEPAVALGSLMDADYTLLRVIK